MENLINQTTELVHRYLGIGIELQLKLAQTIAFSLLLLGVRYLLKRVLIWRADNVGQRYITRKFLNYILGFVALMGLWRIWLGHGSATYAGLLSAGVAIALKDPLTNIAGWIFLILRKPLSVGDRVAVGENAGDVIDIRLFQFTLVEIGNWVDADQSTGRIIHIPNQDLFNKPLSNYTQGFNFIWNEIPITVTFESDWEKAKQLLCEIAQKHTAIRSESAAREVRKAARTYLIHFQHLTPIVWTSVSNHGVTLTIRYLCAPRSRRSSAEKIWEEVLHCLGKEKSIDFAYPTQRFYNNLTEGQPRHQEDTPHQCKGQ